MTKYAKFQEWGGGVAQDPQSKLIKNLLTQTNLFPSRFKKLAFIKAINICDLLLLRAALHFYTF